MRPLHLLLPDMQTLRNYYSYFKSHGLKGMMDCYGRVSVAVLFAFFLIKGLFWLFLIYGGVEWLG
jgi:hypothetical protein